MSHQVSEQKEGDPEDSMERRWLFRNRTGTAEKGVLGRAERRVEGGGADLCDSASFGGAAGSSGRAVASFPF
jgi:hypothetical protein